MCLFVYWFFKKPIPCFFLKTKEKHFQVRLIPIQGTVLFSRCHLLNWLVLPSHLFVLLVKKTLGQVLPSIFHL